MVTKLTGVDCRAFIYYINGVGGLREGWVRPYPGLAVGGGPLRLLCRRRLQVLNTGQLILFGGH